MAEAFVMVYATLRKKLGFSKIALRGSTVGDLLDRLCALKAPHVREVLLDGAGAVKNHFVLVLNSEMLDNGRAAGVKVKNGDILHIFPPVSGG